MWSRRFLWTALSSGVAVAALTLGGLWLALFVMSGSKDPTWTPANIVKFALPGLFVYSACWYTVIFRNRNYSVHQTMVLVVATFGAVSVVAATVMMIAGLYVAMTILLKLALSWKVASFAALGLLAYVASIAIWVALGAVILILPYMIFAAPMALLHRWLLLKLFAAVGPATPNTGSIIPVIP